MVTHGYEMFDNIVMVMEILGVKSNITQLFFEFSEFSQFEIYDCVYYIFLVSIRLCCFYLLEEECWDILGCRLRVQYPFILSFGMHAPVACEFTTVKPCSLYLPRQNLRLHEHFPGG
jgi:hypothetical protein